MSKRKQLEETVLMRAVRTGGLRSAIRAVSFLASYLIQWADEGLPPRDWVAYREYWGVSEAVMFRELADFRKCFPEFDHPREYVLGNGLLELMDASLPKEREAGTAAVAGWRLAA